MNSGSGTFSKGYLSRPQYSKYIDALLYPQDRQMTSPQQAVGGLQFNDLPAPPLKNRGPVPYHFAGNLKPFRLWYNANAVSNTLGQNIGNRKIQ
jgi:hypothetical protein